MNKNKDKCTFGYANFARVVASTDNSDGSVLWSPEVNNDGDNVTLTASTTAEGLIFDHWELNGTNVSTNATYSFTIANGNYGNYKAIFATARYPDDGTYIFKNVGTEKYASYGTNILLPTAQRENHFCKEFTITVNKSTGELTTATSGTDNAYSYRADLTALVKTVLESLGLNADEAETFVTEASRIYTKPAAGGYRFYHRVPALSAVTDWDAFVTALIAALPSSNLTSGEQPFVEKFFTSVKPENVYYLTAATDGSSINYDTEEDSKYNLWNTEVYELDYLSTSNGFYRLKNYGTGEYASFVGNDFDKPSSTNVDFDGLAAMKDENTALSDAGSVFWVRYNSMMCTVNSQRYNTYANVGDWFYLQTEGLDKGLTNISVWGIAFLTATTDSRLSGSTSGTDKNAQWILEPLTSASVDKYYFGAAPSAAAEVNGKYYTTLYCAFPFQCLDGVKAYYISACQDGTATLKVIENGKVPAQTGVILECNSTLPKENRLLPIPCTMGNSDTDLTCTDKEVVAITDNLLAGEYFCLKNDNYDNRKKSVEGSEPYVLSKSGGKLVFAKLRAGNYLAANKAYLPHSVVESALQGAKALVLDFDKGGVTGIDDIRTPYLAPRTSEGIYTLDGRKVSLSPEGGAGGGLPRGIYIVNGKKVVIK